MSTAPVHRYPLRGRPALWEVAVVFALGLGLGIALFHQAWAWPSSTLVGSAGDADEYSWFLSWAPFAIGHGLDPLVSHYVDFPAGVNLMWNTSVLLPAWVMSPVTVVFGAAFSYNVLVTAAPVLCTTFAYVAFRRWTGRPAALGGALVFGFSPYIVSQSVGHLSQTLIMSAPLMLVLADRLLVVQSGRTWLDGSLLGLLAWAQLLTGEELLAMEAVTAVIAVAALCAIGHRELGEHFAYAVRGLWVAAGVFAVLAAPFLAVQYLGPYKVQNAHPANRYVTDLLNFVVPTRSTQLAPAAALRASRHFTGNGSEHGAYIGIPLVLFLVLALVLARRRPVTWVALAVAAGAAVLSMGPTVHVLGHITHVYLPGYVLQKLPVLRNLLPDRFASTMTLGVGLLVALGLDELKHLRRPALAGGWALAGAGLAAIVPTVHFAASASPLFSAFYAGSSCPPAAPGPSPSHPPVAIVLPVVNELDLRWQAESKFCFVMPSATGMTGTSRTNAQEHGLLFRAGSPSMRKPPLTAAARQEAAQEVRALDIKEIVVSPQSPSQPLWSYQDQAQLVAWVEWLLGQAPRQSHEIYITYVWDSLPPAGEIASGRFGPAPTPGVPAPPAGRTSAAWAPRVVPLCGASSPRAGRHGSSCSPVVAGSDR